MQSSAPAPGAQSTWDSALGAIEDSISQCPFLQMTYTAETPHADGSVSPGARPRYQPNSHSYLYDTSCTHDNRMSGRQTSCRQQTAPPQSRCSKDVTAHLYLPGSSPGLPCPVPTCIGQPQSGRSGFSSPLQNRIFFPEVHVLHQWQIWEGRGRRSVMRDEDQEPVIHCKLDLRHLAAAAAALVAKSGSM